MSCGEGLLSISSIRHANLFRFFSHKIVLLTIGEMSTANLVIDIFSDHPKLFFSSHVNIYSKIR